MTDFFLPISIVFYERWWRKSSLDIDIDNKNMGVVLLLNFMAKIEYCDIRYLILMLLLRSYLDAIFDLLPNIDI